MAARAKSAIDHFSPAMWCLLELLAILLSMMPNQVGKCFVTNSVNNAFYFSASVSTFALIKWA